MSTTDCTICCPIPNKIDGSSYPYITVPPGSIQKSRGQMLFVLNRIFVNNIGMTVNPELTLPFITTIVDNYSFKVPYSLSIGENGVSELSDETKTCWTKNMAHSIYEHITYTYAYAYDIADELEIWNVAKRMINYLLTGEDTMS
jgi:hypothetical protein